MPFDFVETDPSDPGIIVPGESYPRPGIGGFQLTEDLALLIGVGLIVIVFLILVAYVVINKKKKEAERKRTRDFTEERYVQANKSFDQGSYNNRVMMLMVPMLMGLILSVVLAVVVNDSVFAPIIMGSGLGLTCVLIIMIYLDLDRKERSLNSNKEWGDITAYYQAFGFIQQTWRRMVPEKEEVIFTKTQLTAFAKMFRTYILDIIGTLTLPAKQVQALKRKLSVALIEARIEKLKWNLFTVREDFKILVGLKHAYNDCINPKFQKRFDAFIYVDVKTVPLYLVHIPGAVNKINELNNDKGKQTWFDSSVGVFLTVADRIDLLEAVAKGRFEAPDIIDAIMLKALHGYSEDNAVAESMESYARKLDKRTDERDDWKISKKTEEKKAFNNLYRAADLLNGPKTREDRVLDYLGIFSFFALFVIMFLILTGKLVWV